MAGAGRVGEVSVEVPPQGNAGAGGADDTVTTPDSATKKKSKRPRSSPWKRRTVGLLVALFIVWLVAAGVEVLLGVRDDAHGMAQIQMARSDMSASDVVSGSAIGPLRAAGSDFTAGTARLRSVVLDPLEIVPVIGRQLGSARDLSDAATQTAQIGVRALGQGKTILASSHSAGEARIQTLHSVSQLASTTYTELSKINPGTGTALLSPLASKHDTFVRDLNQLRTTLHNASLVTASVANVLQGPDTYLVLMGNNAEMRVGSGMFLEAGVLTTDNGTMTLSDLQPTAPLQLPPGKVVVTGDLEARAGLFGARGVLAKHRVEPTIRCGGCTGGPHVGGRHRTEGRWRSRRRYRDRATTHGGDRPDHAVQRQCRDGRQRRAVPLARPVRRTHHRRRHGCATPGPRSSRRAARFAHQGGVRIA